MKEADFGNFFGREFGECPAPDVFGMTNRLKMLRVDAPSVAAEMVKFAAIRDWQVRFEQVVKGVRSTMLMT